MGKYIELIQGRKIQYKKNSWSALSVEDRWSYHGRVISSCETKRYYYDNLYNRECLSVVQMADPSNGLQGGWDARKDYRPSHVGAKRPPHSKSLCFEEQPQKSSVTGIKYTFKVMDTKEITIPAYRTPLPLRTATSAATVSLSRVGWVFSFWLVGFFVYITWENLDAYN